MEFDCQHCLHISSQTTYKNDLSYHRKYHIKYAKDFNLAASLRLVEKRDWHLFFKRMKILRKIDSSPNLNSTLEPTLPFAIEILKGRRCLTSIPIKFRFSHAQSQTNKFHACKLIKCLKTPKELVLSMQGKIENIFNFIINKTQALTKITSFKMQISSLSPNQIDISQGIKTFYKVLNRFSNLSKVTIHLQDVQLSDQSLRELFDCNKLKKPITDLQLLCDRLLDIEEDQFDDFAAPMVFPSNSVQSIWEKFLSIETLAKSLAHLHLQPLLRSALDHNCLKFFLIPLAKLQNLRTLRLEMPNLELSDEDCSTLASSINSLKNLRVIKIFVQFGMITQKTLDRFFAGFAGLNLHEVDMNLTYATMSDFSEFYRAIPTNVELERVSYDMTYLANVQYDPSLCGGMLNCKNLRHIRLAEKPLMKGLLPSREKFNTCFKGLFGSFVNMPRLQSFCIQGPKTTADNDNIRVITEVLPALPDLRELTFDVTWKDYAIDYEYGMKFWEAIFQNTKYKILNFMALFKGAENLLPYIRKRIETMKALECFYVNFESETLSAEQIVLFVKRIAEHEIMKDLRLYFRVKLPLTSRHIEKIQQILNKAKYLKKCLIEIQTNNGQQSISSEAKGIFRPGQDIYYL